jgi:hypothetical protein
MGDEQLKDLRKNLLNAFKKEYSPKDIEIRSTARRAGDNYGFRVVCPDGILQVERTSTIPTYHVSLFPLLGGMEIPQMAIDCLRTQLPHILTHRGPQSCDGVYKVGDRTFENDLPRIVTVMKEVSRTVVKNRNDLEAALEDIAAKHKPQ